MKCSRWNESMSSVKCQNQSVVCTPWSLCRTNSKGRIDYNCKNATHHVMSNDEFLFRVDLYSKPVYNASHNVCDNIVPCFKFHNSIK